MAALKSIDFQGDCSVRVAGPGEFQLMRCPKINVDSCAVIRRRQAMEKSVCRAPRMELWRICMPSRSRAEIGGLRRRPPGPSRDHMSSGNKE